MNGASTEVNGSEKLEKVLLHKIEKIFIFNISN